MGVKCIFLSSGEHRNSDQRIEDPYLRLYVARAISKEDSESSRRIRGRRKGCGENAMSCRKILRRPNPVVQRVAVW